MGLFEDLLADHWSMRCKIHYDLFVKYKEGWGESFDKLPFVNYETGEMCLKGADLRDVQTGCELLERQGWHKSGFSHDPSFRCGCRQFDEQLCFVSKEGKPLSNTDYCVTLGDGRTVNGTTDNVGKTKRIKNTQIEQPIEKVEFITSERVQPLCPKNRIQSGKCIKEVALSGVTTNKENVGSSVRKVTVEGNARPLTHGEIEMARQVFKSSIDYSKVKVHKEEWLPFGVQNDDTAMTPNGEMYFNPEKGFKEDFANTIVKPDDKIWFMHEMVHVWQWQLGYWVKLHGAALVISGGYANGGAYKYDSPENNSKTLPDFNMEQQGAIIAEYFGAKFLNDKYLLPKLPVLERILKNFLRSPKDANLLPK
jgi:hypothetical protein